ncbi:hypothetical protein EV562_10530 [Streptomyces sp. BK208]|nr:hypothetical protein EV562_10530 [Streptomyces sp. BK208]
MLLSRGGGLPYTGPHGEKWWHIFHSGCSTFPAAGFSPSGHTIAVVTSSDLTLWTRQSTSMPKSRTSSSSPPG